MGERKVGSLGIIIVAFVICIAGSAGATYFLVGQIKQSEIDNLKSQYETEKSQYETQISGLNSQVDNLQNILNVDNPNYVKQMVKGLQAYTDGEYYRGCAHIHRSEAGDYYDIDLFYSASVYAITASLFYESSSKNYSLAKGFFEEAKNYGSNNNTQELAQLFVDLSEYSAQRDSELIDAYEDYSSACDYYYNGNYDLGGFKLEASNDHVETSNGFFDSHTDCLSDIDFLLENFLISTD